MHVAICTVWLNHASKYLFSKIESKKVEYKRCEAEYIVDPDADYCGCSSGGNNLFIESSNENMHFEVSFIKRFAFFPLNEVDIPKPICHKQSFDIFKW